jgi:hypothetical protein
MPDWERAQSDLALVYARWSPLLAARAVAEAEGDYGGAIDVPAASLEQLTVAIGERAALPVATLRDQVATAINTAPDAQAATAALAELLEGTTANARRVAVTETAHVWNSAKALAAGAAGLAQGESNG